MLLRIVCSLDSVDILDVAHSTDIVIHANEFLVLDRPESLGTTLSWIVVCRYVVHPYLPSRYLLSDP